MSRPRTAFEELHPPFDESQAILEASRCLECGGPYAPAPCVTACPAGIDIPRFIREIHQGDPAASARTIFRENPLGGTCARVCPVPELCEGACVLHTQGRRAVAIGRLQRYAADYALYVDRGVRLFKKPRKRQRRTASVGIIGAGPAGLACAAVLAQMGYAVTVYEARPKLGGLVPYAIAPYKQQDRPLPDEARRIAELGVQFHTGVRVGEDIPLEELERRHEALFLGVGLGEDVDVRFEGEDDEGGGRDKGKDMMGVYNSLEFIERLKAGRPPEVGRRVVVIGGGNTAIDVAREARRLGAENVDVIVLYRRTEEEMPAYRHEVEEARREGVHFYWLANPKALEGKGRVKRLRCEHVRLGEPDESGRRRPERLEGSEFTLEVDTVIKAIGQKKRTDFLKRIPGLRLEGGLVVVDEETGQTSNPKYFAGGDCVTGGETVVRAVAHGKRAAQGIHRFLSSHLQMEAEEGRGDGDA